MTNLRVKKIVLFGPESTGKTTLAQQLAAHYHTVWIPEYSRTYQEEQGRPLNISDVIPIARGQIRLEEEAFPKANNILICDTDILETKVYSEVYNGACPPWLLDTIPRRLADLYLLTQVDLPWIPDGIRDRPDDREQMYALFKKELYQLQLPFAEIWGSYQHRFVKAVEAIDVFMGKKE
ncbi:ATP-binding protein [Rhodocytophaga rosea]|uniref:ATP-binding protein n=1 Tax=Rhodocytophaga rosea TaxID=2704465 RepID=A0A6C0GHM7_9BACT|nr:ATP-binding protein [Rhodocytophaga rosea]QHT67459.1 ATP-binding protein [Rhodocytophaga rosea]